MPGIAPIASNPILAMMLSFYSVCLSANNAQGPILDFELVLKVSFCPIQIEIHLAILVNKEVL